MSAIVSVLQNSISNVGSVCNALEFLKVPYRVVRTPEELSQAERLIFPGVGAFGAAMEHLSNNGLAEVLTQKVRVEKIPFLGICLGLQLLFEDSEESQGVKGLGWFKGSVVRLKAQPPQHRVPNMGWCALRSLNLNPSPYPELDGNFVYFVHSYAAKPNDTSIISHSAQHAEEFVAGVCENNIQAFQFHPEKSGKLGLKILRVFTQLAS